MKTFHKPQIWKFSQGVDKVGSRILEIEMPKGSVILSVQNQRGEIAFWALCEPKAQKVTRKILDIGTGQENTQEPTTTENYIGTVQFFDGLLVRHFFDLGEC